MPEWSFPLSPVAASRPRVSRRGAYFTGPYKEFRKDMVEIIPIVLGDGFVPYSGPLRVDIEFYCRRPKTTKLSAPRADVDNYIKAALDALNTYLWDDDTQIQKIYAAKQWAEPGAEGYFTVGVDQL